jgi:two-component system, sensor histidine kinase
MQSNQTLISEKATKRVIIIDDNHDVADSLAQWLTLAGHDVHTFYTGEDALINLPQIKPDVVLLDIGLPDINGYEVARRLRAIPGVPRFTLVAVTGYGQPADSDVFRSAGFDEYFSKPMHFSKLKSIGLDL